MNLPVAHPVVDDGVDSTVGHGQPLEAEVDVLDVGGPHDLRVVVGVDEVYMVGEPADYKEDDHNEAHLDNLPLLLHSPGNGWLPDGVLTHAEQVVPATP